jgi:hypothetical protein
MNAYKIVNKYDNVIRDYYEGVLLGFIGREFTSLYLDLQSNEIFQNITALKDESFNRTDESISEIAHDEGFGSNLDDDEFEYLKENGVSDFGYQDWIDDYLIPKIEAALQNWKDKQCKK